MMFSRYTAYDIAHQLTQKKATARRETSVAEPAASGELAMFVRLGAVTAVFSAALGCILWVAH